MRNTSYITNPVQPRIDTASGTDQLGRGLSLQQRYASLASFLSNYGTASPIPDSNKLVDKLRRHEIRQQLRDVGMPAYELMRRECRTLYKYLHKSEYVHAAIGGWGTRGSFAILVATSHRIIYLKQQPLFTTLDEISYDMVGAISLSTTRWYATVTLHARTGDYRLEFVNTTAARIFSDYVERKSIDSTAIRSTLSTTSTQAS